MFFIKRIRNFLKQKEQDLLKIPDEYVNVAYSYRKDWVEKKAKTLKRGANILDVGAGPCQYKPLFKHCHYTSQDFMQYRGNKKGLLADKWNYGKIDIISDIAKIPVKDKSYDAILCTEVLEHVPYPIEAIKEMARILKPGGKLWITAPFASGLHQEPYHFYGGYSPYFYKLFSQKFDLKIKEIQPTGGFFKHLAQELWRAGDILEKRKKIHIVSKILFKKTLPLFFAKLDKTIYIKEFTIGYLIEAEKLK
ncbi:class I SAM-dependent methyltransferase [Candidatus Beckwithbacteria bacterium]|nr:class I SAM-dependent methyltransferase [Candidatus Beckwithbacteria bacterium]